jgi:transcriptional regulator with XRE-family HTH domain
MEISSMEVLSTRVQNNNMKTPMKMHPMHPSLVGDRLEAARKALGLSKRLFAQLIDVDPSSYSKICKGEKPLKPEHAYNLATQHNIGMDFFYRGDLSDLPDRLSNSVVNFLTAAKE